MSDTERDQERVVMDIAGAQWDTAPYSLALEIKRFLESRVDEGQSIDSGTGRAWPWGAPNPIEGEGEADLHATIDGVEFHINVRKSNSQLLKDGISREQLGIPPLS